ncbi:hypothetical protein PG996_011830 [Apiospora saccharicola]|uniref:Hyaluronan/mRNA-binding protein domain-containing protein n=1 Tax=Apiospora saccharicola TaxID=335842 RepID=A0ABR1UG56_9PEZI
MGEDSGSDGSSPKLEFAKPSKFRKLNDRNLADHNKDSRLGAKRGQDGSAGRGQRGERGERGERGDGGGGGGGGDHDRTHTGGTGVGSNRWQSRQKRENGRNVQLEPFMIISPSFC